MATNNPTNPNVPNDNSEMSIIPPYAHYSDGETELTEAQIEEISELIAQFVLIVTMQDEGTPS